jgi:DNA-binding XRE family transcriptional regulator
MSELGNLLKNLRGKRSQASLAEACGLSNRTIVRAESGSDVALSTVRAVAKHFKVKDPEYAALLRAWINLQLGEDVKHLVIESAHKDGAKKSKYREERFWAKFRELPAQYQEQLTLAMERKEVLRSLVPINDLWYNLKNPPS